MKQPKKLTRESKEYLRKRDLNPDEWMLLAEDSHKYVYITKDTKTTLTRLKALDRR